MVAGTSALAAISSLVFFSFRKRKMPVIMAGSVVNQYSEMVANIVYSFNSKLREEADFASRIVCHNLDSKSRIPNNFQRISYVIGGVDH